MSVIKCKPTSPGRRHLVKVSRFRLYKGRAYSLLSKGFKKSGGRNHHGHITTRHIGGGHKKCYRLIDFKRNKDDIQAIVERLEYDPNRSANIALLLYKDGDRRYILAPKGLEIGACVQSGAFVPVNIGNSLPISNIPAGSMIHNVEINPGRGGQLVRSAGGYAQVVSYDIANNYVLVRFRSGEIRKIHSSCRATLGEVGNSEHMLRVLGKAGSKRWLGIRPTVRGTAMNPVDHPHGGGEGRNFGKHPVSPFGLLTKGKKTRKNKRTNKFIVHARTR